MFKDCLTDLLKLEKRSHDVLSESDFVSDLFTTIFIYMQAVSYELDMLARAILKKKLSELGDSHFLIL